MSNSLITLASVSTDLKAQKSLDLLKEKREGVVLCFTASQCMLKKSSCERHVKQKTDRKC